MGPIMLSLESYELEAVEQEIITHPLVGGIILFARNFYDIKQLQELIKRIRILSRTRLLLAVDQEGGRVQRFKEGFTLLPAAQSFLALNSPLQAAQLAKEAGWIMAAELTSLDIDISFAPVLDLGHLCPAISERAFHEKTELALPVIRHFILGMRAAGMASVGKHFPGHGTVQTDSHYETPIDSRSFEEIDAHDLLPYRLLIEEQQLTAIMLAHIIYQQVDSLPASFSPYWLQKVLRKRLQFSGIIFSDDLSMAGASAMGSYTQRAKAALAAGCDMILICNNQQGAIEVIDSLPYQNVAKLNPLFHHATFDRSQLLSSSRWRQANKRVSSLAERWQNRL